MKTEQVVLARITPAGVALGPMFFVGMVGLLWLTPLMWGSYEAFLEHSRRALGWQLMTPLLTLASVVLAGALIYPPVRHRRAIVLMDGVTVTLVGVTTKSVRLADIADAGRADHMFSVTMANGEVHSLGAAFWDRPHEEVAAALLAAREPLHPRSEQRMGLEREV